MTQEIFTGQVELTVRGINPTLNRGGEIFMSDAGINTEAPQAVRPVATSGELPALPRVGGMSLEGLTPAQQIDAKRTIKLIEDLGLKPKEVTSKGRTEQTVQSVVENAGLDSQDPVVLKRSRDLANKEDLTVEETAELLQANSGRISKAEELLKESLGRELTDTEKKAILKAHFVGFGEKGKAESRESGVFNVSQEQLAEKARILKDAGFDKEQRREIIESGLAAMGPPPPLAPPDYRVERNNRITAMMGIDFGNADLNEIVQHLTGVHAASGPDGISSENLVGILNQWIRARDEGKLKTTPPDRYIDFANRVAEIGEFDSLMRGSGRIEEDFADEARYFAGEINAAAAAAAVGVAGAAAQEALLRAQFKESINDFVGRVNPFETGLRDSTLKIVVQDEEALERLAFRIVGAPLQSETGDYSLGFYGQINIDAITNLLQTLAENPNLTPDPAIRATRNAQKENINNIMQGVRTMHELNKYIVTGRLEGAQQIADGVLPKYQQVLQKWKGVALVERLLEAAHSVTVSRDGYINVDNDQEMMGTKINKVTGKFEAKQEGSVYAEFKELMETLNANPALRVGALAGFGNMEEWEISLAYNLGRALFNNQQRKAAWTSQGQVPAGNRAWESTPLEGFNKIFNPARWLYSRFTIGKGRGGMRWFERFTDAMQRYKHTEGWNHSGITKIRDDNVEMFELPTMTGVRDWMASWRAVGMTMRQTRAEFQFQGALTGFQVAHQEAGSNRIPINPAETSLGLILNTDALIFTDAAGAEIKWGDMKDNARTDYFRSIFFTPGTDELRPDLQSALGVIYRVSLSPSGGHHGIESFPKFNKIKEDIRTKIWERVAEDNPLAIIPYLNKMEYGHGGVTHKTFGGRDVFRATPGVDWPVLQRKLDFLNEIRLAKVRGVRDPNNAGAYLIPPDSDFNLQDAISHVQTALGGGYDIAALPINHPRNMHNLSPDEEAFLAEVKTEAHHVSRDMANVKFAFAPFMNDVILEDTDYDQPGQEAFVRHFRDMAQFNATNGAIAEAMDNLGLIKDYHGMVEFIAKFAKGITGVHGDDTAKEKAYPVIEATVAFFRRGENLIDKGDKYEGEGKLSPKQKLVRWIKQQDEVHEIAQKLHKPNSEAQMYYNIKALTLDRGQMYEAMEDLAAAGLMGHDQEEEFKKRFAGKGGPKGIFGFITRMVLEGVMRGTKGALLVGTTEITKRSFKGAVS